MSRTAGRVAIAGVGAGYALLLLVVAVNAASWIGRTFPGFFLVSNRVVPSVALGDWADGRASRFFQHRVVAVDGLPVATAAEVYGRVTAEPAGSPMTYTFQAPTGEVWTATVRSRRFSATDYAALFGAFLFSSVFFAGTGLLVAYLKPGSAASLGLLNVGLTTGLFVGTAPDLYGPHWFVRLHLVAETLVAPAFFHLALVFPRERLAGSRPIILRGLYLAFGALAILYELALGSPSAYTQVHLLASGAQALGGAAIIAAVAHDLVTSPSVLVRRRIAIVALGTFAAFLLPALTMAASAARGGAVALNGSAFTAFLFPLSLGYAIIKQDLFEIDVMLRRTATYVIVVLCVGAANLSVLALLGFLLPKAGLPPQSPFTMALLNVALLFLLAPLQAQVQEAIDRVFYRKRYDTDLALSQLSRSLVSAHTPADVFARTHAVLGETVCPITAEFFALHEDGRLQSISGNGGGIDEVVLSPNMAERLRRGELLVRYQWDDDERAVPEALERLRADLVIPIGGDEAPTAMLALGPKQSGRPYNVADVAFLRAAESQVALAMMNAEAFAELEAWNTRLEQEVRERTAELERFVDELRAAYQQLETKQASLMRADRLATLGRLTAGIAHEVNTPLGATLNALTIIRELSHEYGESIDDASVSLEDHRDIARELLTQAEAASGWARKAAAFINRVRVQGREAEPAAAAPFRLATVVAETEALLAHRLRGMACRLEYGADEDVVLTGDPSRLGQVLINLVANAIDAYEERGIVDGRIEIRAARQEGVLALTVRDRAGGIPAHLVPRLFEEMFTTKEAGRGTGLGLCIARSLVEQSFGGTLTVEVDEGAGSCFTIALPPHPPSRAETDPGPETTTDAATTGDDRGPCAPSSSGTSAKSIGA